MAPLRNKNCGKGISIKRMERELQKLKTEMGEELKSFQFKSITFKFLIKGSKWDANKTIPSLFI